MTDALVRFGAQIDEQLIRVPHEYSTYTYLATFNGCCA